MKYRLLFVTFLSVLITACSSPRKVALATASANAAYTLVKIDSNYKADKDIAAFLQPYSKEVGRQMNVVIGTTETPLERKTPEGTLGNFVADAMRQRAALSYKTNVDMAFVNYGGLRVDNIAAGPVVLGKMYELIPFDNIVVLLHLNGNTLHTILDLIAAKEGWPVSGVKMKIANGKAKDILINGEPLNDDKQYTVATTDYTAKGNEGFTILKTIPQQNNGYLFRDALIDYVKALTANNKKINAVIENRITNAE